MKVSPLTQIRVCRMAGEPLPKLSEDQFRDAVVELARDWGWKVAYFRAARVQRGGREIYETPVGADGRGFPDVELVRERLLKRELKAGRGTATPEQLDWLARYEQAGVDAGIWRYPEDWDKVEEALK